MTSVLLQGHIKKMEYSFDLLDSSGSIYYKRKVWKVVCDLLDVNVVCTQFLCHEWYTIFNSGFMGTLEGKIEYFSGTIQWLQIDGRYTRCISYHLHILIVISLTVTIIYSAKIRKRIRLKALETSSFTHTMYLNSLIHYVYG